MLVGQVAFRPDQAVQGVSVELCDSKFQNCTRQDTTDANGHFGRSIGEKPTRYLLPKVSSSGTV